MCRGRGTTGDKTLHWKLQVKNEPSRGLWHMVYVQSGHWRPVSETHTTFGQDAMSIPSHLKSSDEHVSEKSEMENKTLDCTVRKFII